MKKNRHRLRFTAAFGLWSALAVMVSSAVGEEAKIVTLRPPELGFFSKQIVYEGIAIKAHKAVSDAALLEARRRMAQMLAQVPVVVQNLVDFEAELHVLGQDQQTSDMPFLRL